jgi:DNA-binding NarL/FixJ family response regulator
MDNSSRFSQYIKALNQFAMREGHCRVPAIHIEIFEGKEISLGSWVGYIRQRHRKNLLSQERTWLLETVYGWEWGPLKPGPATDSQRNKNILNMRAAGSSLRQIADTFDLSRQRVHQIVKKEDAQ